MKLKGKTLIRTCQTGVNQLARVMNDPLDLSFLLQMSDSNPCKTPVDLQPLDEDALADEFEGGDFLHDTVICGFVKGDGVLCFVLDFSLGPLLLLCGFAA